MLSFSSFLFSDNAYFNFRCHCFIREHTYEVAPSSVRCVWWQQHTAFLGGLVPHKVASKNSSSSNIISLARITCCKYEFTIWYTVYFTSRKTQLNITSYACHTLNQEFKISGPLEIVRFSYKKKSRLNAGIAWYSLLQIFLLSTLPKP